MTSFEVPVSVPAMALTPTLCENWAEVAEEEVSSQEWLGAQTMLADQCRESSASLPESGNDSDWEGPDTVGIWWTEMIFSASKSLGYSNPTTKNHIKAISGCTGISAEGWVFKAGLRFCKQKTLDYDYNKLFLLNCIFGFLDVHQLLPFFLDSRCSSVISQFPHTSALPDCQKNHGNNPRNLMVVCFT